MDYTPIPAVVPVDPFDAAADAAALRDAMKGLGTNEQEIIDILTARSNAQRQQIKEKYLSEYDCDLIEDLKSELGGIFEEVIIALMMPPVEYMCKQLHKAMEGMGTDDSTLVEILCTKSNEEMAEIVQCYEDMYDRPLAEHLCSETDGHFRRLLTLIITGVRDPVGIVDTEKAKQQAEQLYNAGEDKLGTDEEVFNRILAHGSFAHLRLVFEEYKELSGQTLEQAIEHEMAGEMHEAMMAIVECVQSPAAFFAHRLFDAISGAGTADTTLIRIIVSRSEIDLGNIKDEFERIYNRTLFSAIMSETSGDYKKVLCALIGGA
ncbi:annexin B10-like [Musca autumnalis]|uniref:annexin B10-like n=1 Tax=Musca autumnalis TaxID=221902 RepID=UPI003CF4B45D